MQAILTVLGRRRVAQRALEMQLLDLSGSDLRGANLIGAHLEGAYLYLAHLEWANLRDVTGRTQTQIAFTYMNEHTTLPTEPGPDGEILRRSTHTATPPAEHEE